MKNLKCILAIIFISFSFHHTFFGQSSKSIDIYLKAGLKAGMYMPNFSDFYKAYPNQDWNKKFGMTYILDPYFELTIQEMVLARVEFNYSPLVTSNEYNRTAGILDQQMKYGLIPINLLLYYKHNLIDPNHKNNQVNRFKPFAGAGVGMCIINSEYSEIMTDEIDNKVTSSGSASIYYVAAGAEYVSRKERRLSYSFEVRYAFGSFKQPLEVINTVIEEKMKFNGPQIMFGLSYRLGAVGRGVVN